MRKRKSIQKVRGHWVIKVGVKKTIAIGQSAAFYAFTRSGG